MYCYRTARELARCFASRIVRPHSRRPAHEHLRSSNSFIALIFLQGRSIQRSSGSRAAASDRKEPLRPRITAEPRPALNPHSLARCRTASHPKIERRSAAPAGAKRLWEQPGFFIEPNRGGAQSGLFCNLPDRHRLSTITCHPFCQVRLDKLFHTFSSGQSQSKVAALSFQAKLDVDERATHVAPRRSIPLPAEWWRHRRETNSYPPGSSRTAFFRDCNCGPSSSKCRCR